MYIVLLFCLVCQEWEFRHGRKDFGFFARNKGSGWKRICPSSTELLGFSQAKDAQKCTFMRNRVYPCFLQQKLRYSTPELLHQLINMLYNIVDRIYIGHIPEIGADALTGVGVCMPLIMTVSYTHLIHLTI